MVRSHRRADRYPYLVACMMIYIIGGLVLLPFYRYQMILDGVAYVSIAEKYVQADFKDAVNGCCGPLLSRLLTPFLLAGFFPLFADRLVMLLVGLIILVVVYSLSNRIRVADVIRKAILGASVPTILYYALCIISPDLFILCALILYLSIVFDPSYPARLTQGVACVLVGALTYLSKSYALPFFLFHFPLINCLYFLRNAEPVRKRHVLYNLSAGLVLFFLNAYSSSHTRKEHGKRLLYPQYPPKKSVSYPRCHCIQRARIRYLFCCLLFAEPLLLCDHARR